MQIVSQFELGPRIWDVQFVDTIPRADDEDEPDGLCDYPSATIFIRRNLDPAYTRVVFYHEFVHAVMFTMGRTDHDEVEVDAIGQLLAQFAKTAKA